MKALIILCTLLLTLTSCSSQNKLSDTITSQFSALKGRLFQSSEEKQLDKIYKTIREGNIEKAELEIPALSSPFMRALALGYLANYQIRERNDLIGAKKVIEKLENSINIIPSKEDKLFSEIQLADLMHFIDKRTAKEMLKVLEPAIWSIVSPEERSRLLNRLILLELETERDISKAKATIKQTIQTINFIKNERVKSDRLKELENILQVNNHLLSEHLEK